MTAQPPAEAVDVLDTSQAGPAAVIGGSMRVAAFAIGTLAGVASSALLLRHLGVVAFGRYGAILALVAIVAGLSDLGLTVVAVREASARPAAERESILRNVLGIRLVLTIIGVSAMTAVAASAYPRVYLYGVPIAGLGLLLQTVQDNYSVLLIVSLRMRWVALLDLVRSLTTPILIAILVLSGAKLLAFVAVGVPVGLLVLVLNVWIIRGERSLWPAFDWQQWRRVLREVLPYSAAVAAAVFYFQMAILMTSLLASGHQLGYFTASFRVIQLLTAVPGLIVGSALPILSRAAGTDHSRLGYALERLFEVSLIIGAWAALSIAALAGLAMSILGGPAFHPAAPVLAIQGVALAGTFVSSVWANGLLSLALYRQILLTTGVALALSIVLMIVLVKADGARGAAIATAIGEVGAAMLGALVLLRRRPSLRPRLRVIPRVALAVAIGSVPLWVGGLPSIVRFLLATILYGGVLAVTRAFPRELDALIPRLPWKHRVDPS
ncbi:MAG TPA: oligosaccharide flippase family protein [Solirubrobacteraceae bacterium]|nr:oligosaccharide flippase family protein [Solirubrobacteraceae bacterium]